MSDPTDPIPSVPDPSPPSPDPAHRKELRRLIEDIVTNEAMPVGERQARLEALAEEWGLGSDLRRSDIEDPLRSELAEAVAMLADGGHR